MFYSIEGIDGAGCGVVRRELEKLLKKKKIPFTALKYPVPNLPFGRDIYDYLDGKFDMPIEVRFLAFIGQMIFEKERLKKLRHRVLIIDRYLPCTLVYQGAEGFPIKKGLTLAKIFDLQIPDKIFYLKVPWKVAYARKKAEAKKSDIFEKDKTLYQKTTKIYDQLAASKILARWVIIDATKTPGEEAEEIFHIIMRDLNKK